jgi:hypothetical protein
MASDRGNVRKEGASCRDSSECALQDPKQLKNTNKMEDAQTRANGEARSMISRATLDRMDCHSSKRSQSAQCVSSSMSWLPLRATKSPKRFRRNSWESGEFDPFPVSWPQGASHQLIKPRNHQNKFK